MLDDALVVVLEPGPYFFGTKTQLLKSGAKLLRAQPCAASFPRDGRGERGSPLIRAEDDGKGGLGHRLVDAPKPKARGQPCRRGRGRSLPRAQPCLGETPVVKKAFAFQKIEGQPRRCRPDIPSLKLGRKEKTRLLGASEQGQGSPLRLESLSRQAEGLGPGLIELRAWGDSQAQDLEIPAAA